MTVRGSSAIRGLGELPHLLTTTRKRNQFSCKSEFSRAGKVPKPRKPIALHPLLMRRAKCPSSPHNQFKTESLCFSENHISRRSQSQRVARVRAERGRRRGRIGKTECLCLAAGRDARESAEMRLNQQKRCKTRKKAGDSAKHHRRPSDLPGGQKTLTLVRKVAGTGFEPATSRL